MVIASDLKWTTKNNKLAGIELSQREPVLCQTVNRYICFGLKSEDIDSIHVLLLFKYKYSHCKPQFPPFYANKEINEI